jgi:hypothetical protein
MAPMPRYSYLKWYGIHLGLYSRWTPGSRYALYEAWDKPEEVNQSRAKLIQTEAARE